MKKILGLFVILSTLVSCTTTNKSAKMNKCNDVMHQKVEAKDLEGKSFRLKNSKYANDFVTINFKNGTVYGNSVVNNYSGLYSLVGDKIKIESLALTLMSSTDEQMHKERTFLYLLETAVKISYCDNKLILTTTDNSELTFIEVK